MKPQVRPMARADWPAVREIFQQGVDMVDATFRTRVPSYEEWDASHFESCRLVAEVDRRVVGWAALTVFSSRDTYRGVGEVSIYIHQAFRGQGVGRALLSALVEASERAGFWSLHANIFAQNQASRALHQRCGFRLMGVWEALGQDARGQWRDVAVMQRRSRVVGAAAADGGREPSAG